MQAIDVDIKFSTWNVLKLDLPPDICSAIHADIIAFDLTASAEQ